MPVMAAMASGRSIAVFYSALVVVCLVAVPVTATAVAVDVGAAGAGSDAGADDAAVVVDADDAAAADRGSAVARVDAGDAAGTADAAGRPDAGTADAATRSDGRAEARFVSDVAAAESLERPRPSANATVTPRGGHASVVGTDAVLASAPVEIRATQRYALTPDAAGEISVTQTFEVPDGVTRLETGVPADAKVTATHGFERTAATRYAWDGEATRATISFTLPVNETVNRGGPEGAAGRYLFVDAGDWALFRRPELDASWGWRGGEPVGMDRDVATSGPGHAGQWFVFLGPTETRTRTAHGQTFSLVVPEAASLAESPATILDSLTAASDQLRVGDRDENVTVFAAPTSVDWGVRGLQFGDADMWVRDVEPLDGPDNTWLHEYTHTRQDFETARSAEWLTEASATYYGALLTLEQDRIDFDAFSGFLRQGTLRPQSTAVLAEPASWAGGANYYKGALVTGAVDRQIRLATDSTRSFGTVLSLLNARPVPIDQSAYLQAVAGVAGRPVGEFAQDYTATSATPQRWSGLEHERAFGETPARFTYQFAAAGSGGSDGSGATGGTDPVTAGSPTLAVTGPFRNGTILGPDDALYAGETVTVTAVVRNAGGATAPYEQFFTVDGRVRSSVTGRLAPGETAVHTFEHTVRTSGDVTVSFGADSLTLAVFEPVRASVGPVRADRTRLDGPGTVTLSVPVRNDHDAPASRTVTVTRDGETVAVRTVELGAGANRTIAVPVELATAGEHTLVVDPGTSLTVSVGGDADASSTAGTGGESPDRTTVATTGTPDSTGRFGPGFGPLVALLGIGLVAALLTVGRRRGPS